MGGEREVEASYASFGRVAWIDLVENPAVLNAISDKPLRSSDILLTRHEYFKERLLMFHAEIIDPQGVSWRASLTSLNRLVKSITRLYLTLS